jgi:outer membrane receptor protein involved in Fe transport
MKRYSLYIFFTFNVLLLHAQQKKSPMPIGPPLKGTLQDARTHLGLSQATIQLKNLADTNQKFRLLSDGQGNFSVPGLLTGTYQLTVQLVGYHTVKLDSIILPVSQTDNQLGIIPMHTAENGLQEVVVISERPLVEEKDGKIIYSVGESALSSGSNASDMLRNMPMLNAQADGSIMLMGRVPLILMDEKPVNVSGQQLADLLESLPASVIEKVEVMQRPPPEYASYPGGVINIVTKKGRVGQFEKVSLSGATRGEGSLFATYGYRSGKWSINAVGGASSRVSLGSGWSQRTNKYADSTNYLHTQSSFSNRSWSPNARFQAEYSPSKYQTISLVYQGNWNYADNYSSILYTNINRFQQAYKASTRNNAFNGDGNGQAFSGSYQWTGKRPAEKLQLFSGIQLNKNFNDRDFFQQYLTGDLLPTGADSTQWQVTDLFTRSGFTNLFYTRPIDDSARHLITSGVTVSSSRVHNVLNSGYLRKSDLTDVPLDKLSNDFFFRQQIVTARLGWIWNWKNQWKLMAAVQMEYTANGFTFQKGNAANASNDYVHWLPSFSIRKEFTRRLNTTFGFRETIRRPGIGEMNPSIDYSDPYNIRFGNPFLQAQLTEMYDWNISYNISKVSFSGTLGFNQVKNVYQPIRTLADSGRTYTTYQNISNQQEYQINLWSGITISKKFRMNLSTGYTYQQYSETQKVLYKYRDGGSFSVGLNYSYAPNPLTLLEANNRFTNWASPQGVSRSNINMSLGIQRKMFKKQVTVGLLAIDPFRIQRYQNTTYGPNFSIESYSESITRNFRLTVSWQISKNVVKSKLSQQQKEEALQKMGGRK